MQPQYGLRKRGNNGGGRHTTDNVMTRSRKPKLNAVLCCSGDGTLDHFYFDTPRMDGDAFFRYYLQNENIKPSPYLMNCQLYSTPTDF